MKQYWKKNGGIITAIAYIILICAMIQLNGCNPRTFYEDQPIVIIEKYFSEDEEYTYEYGIEIVMRRGYIEATPTEQYARMYSNKNYDIGDTIRMGDMWGEVHK